MITITVDVTYFVLTILVFMVMLVFIWWLGYSQGIDKSEHQFCDKFVKGD